METPESADKLRSQLAALQQNLGNLKLAAIEKQAPLRAAIKESEKRSREMDDYEKNVQSLQKWISDTKMYAQAPLVTEEPPSTITPLQKQELQQVSSFLSSNLPKSEVFSLLLWAGSLLFVF